MPHKLITVGTYFTPEEAHLAALALEKEGIRCFYEAEKTVGNFWYLGNAVGYVKLQVGEDHVPQIRAILEEACRPTSGSSALIGRCAECGAKTEPGFEVCWSCEVTLEPEVTPSVEPPSSPQQPSRRDTAVADRGVDEDGEQSRTEAVQRQLDPVSEELAWRAWKAAGIGLCFFPWIFHTYSLWLILRLAFRGGWLSPAGNRKFYAAMFIDLMVVAAIGVFLFMVLGR